MVVLLGVYDMILMLMLILRLRLGVDEKKVVSISGSGDASGSGDGDKGGKGLVPIESYDRVLQEKNVLEEVVSQKEKRITRLREVE